MKIIAIYVLRDGNDAVHFTHETSALLLKLPDHGNVAHTLTARKLRLPQ